MTVPIVTALRDFVPIRPLSRTEALRIAELQAIRFRTLAAITTDALPESSITSLPKVQIERIKPLAVSGATAWSHGRWMILLNAAEPWGRQRFSLAHELKHILDHRFITVLYEGIPEANRHDFIEQVCDYFAGCMLMPRTALKRAWAEGDQSTSALAARFDVTERAIETRLNQIGLGTPTDRCGTDVRDLTTLFGLDPADSSSASYRRQADSRFALAGLQGVQS